MDICQREGLHQVDLLSPAPDRISPQEYYAKQRGQQNLDMADEINRDPHLHEILEEHPSVYIVQIVPLCQHRNQFVAENQRDDDSRNGDHHRIRNVTDHAENTAVPRLI